MAHSTAHAKPASNVHIFKKMRGDFAHRGWFRCDIRENPNLQLHLKSNIFATPITQEENGDESSGTDLLAKPRYRRCGSAFACRTRQRKVLYDPSTSRRRCTGTAAGSCHRRLAQRRSSGSRSKIRAPLQIGRQCVMRTALSTIFPMLAGLAPKSGHTSPYAQESAGLSFQQLRDELLWPRIIVRCAPPPDMIQPIAPARS